MRKMLFGHVYTEHSYHQISIVLSRVASLHIQEEKFPAFLQGEPSKVHSYQHRILTYSFVNGDKICLTICVERHKTCHKIYTTDFQTKEKNDSNLYMYWYLSREIVSLYFNFSLFVALRSTPNTTC